ncbi:MAG TPA: YfiR family protein, partial [Terriglobales bacterium]|nr:YfiR family protein [Terriglobales bacterium]
PVLTVGDSGDFLPLGGVINFVVEQDRVRFEISLAAAQRQRLKISSKLLAVARVVDAGGGGP